MAMLILPFVMMVAFVMVLVSSLLAFADSNVSEGLMSFHLLSVIFAGVIALAMMLYTIDALKHYELTKVPESAEKP